jgi:hypothetical protein
MAVEHTIEDAQVKTRHPFAPLGLSLLTLGVYMFYWYYTINREMRDLGEEVKPGRALLAITLGALIIVPAIMSLYNTGARVARVQERASVTPISPVVALVLLLVPIANYFHAYYLQSGLNAAYESMDDQVPVLDEVSAPVSAPVVGTPPAEPAV